MVVVGLDFEGWEKGGEAVFCYGSAGMRWGHCEEEEKMGGKGGEREKCSSSMMSALK